MTQDDLLREDASEKSDSSSSDNDSNSDSSKSTSKGDDVPRELDSERPTTPTDASDQVHPNSLVTNTEKAVTRGKPDEPAPSGKAKSRTFEWTSASGDYLPVQYRGASIIDCQEKYTFIMDFFDEYCKHLATHSASEWFRQNALPKWIDQFGMGGYDLIDLQKVKIPRRSMSFILTFISFQ